MKYLSENAEPDHILDTPLSKGVEQIVKQFKEDIKKIQTPKTLPSRGTKPNDNTDSEYYTCEEIASKLNLSLKEVKRQIYEHQISGQQKVFDKWKVHKQTFDKWLLRDRQIEI